MLLIDDHPIYRGGVVTTLDRPGLTLHAVEVATFGAALRVLGDQRRFDLILYDWHLPDGGGCKGLVALRQLAPDLPLVVISGLDDDAIDLAARSLGAAAFVAKDASAAKLRGVIYPLLGLASNGEVDPPGVRLTSRQREVLRMMARGDPNKRIAERLGIVDTTVRAHVSDILQLLHARNRTEAVFRANSIGLLDG